jgi:hypothetical protein
MSTLVAKPALDRAMAGARILMTLGPLVVPPVETVRAAFSALVASGNPVRLGYRNHGSGRWEAIPQTISSRLAEIVREAPAEPDDRSLESWLAENLVEDLPVQIALRDGYVSISIDHSLFDAYSAVRLPVLLFDAMNGGEVSAALTESHRAPLVRALLATFGVRPRSWLALYRNIRAHRLNRAPWPPAESSRGERSVPLGAESARTRHVFGVGDADTIDAVMRWGKARRIPGAPTFLYLAMCALEASEVATSGDGYILVDLRRYLPDGVRTTGNFIASLPVRVGDPQGPPAALGDDVRDGLAAGRPLASVALRTAKQRLRRPAAPSGDVRVPAPSRARLSMSVLSSLPGWERLPWMGDPRARSIRLATDSAEPATIGWVSVRFGDRTYFSATYRADVFDGETLERAMALVTQDPLAVLDAVSSVGDL